MAEMTVLVLAIALLISPTLGQTFSASCNGKNEMPPTTSTATAQFNATLINDTVSWTVKLMGITNLTMGHIHAGNASTSGAVLVSLIPTTGSAAMLSPPMSGDLTFNGTFTAAKLGGPLAGKTLADFTTYVESAGAYVNFHTTQNPGGDIRGQLLAAGKATSVAPPPPSGAVAHAAFTVLGFVSWMGIVSLV